jgi:hypothetical protein
LNSTFPLLQPDQIIDDREYYISPKLYSKNLKHSADNTHDLSVHLIMVRLFYGYVDSRQIYPIDNFENVISRLYTKLNFQKYKPNTAGMVIYKILLKDFLSFHLSKINSNFDELLLKLSQFNDQKNVNKIYFEKLTLEFNRFALAKILEDGVKLIGDINFLKLEYDGEICRSKESYIHKYLRSIEENSTMPFLSSQESEAMENIQQMCFDSSEDEFCQFLGKFDMDIVIPVLRKESIIMTNHAVAIYNDLIFAGLVDGTLPPEYVENGRFMANKR